MNLLSSVFAMFVSLFLEFLVLLIRKREVQPALPLLFDAEVQHTLGFAVGDPAAALDDPANHIRVPRLAKWS